MNADRRALEDALTALMRTHSAWRKAIDAEGPETATRIWRRALEIQGKPVPTKPLRIVR